METTVSDASFDTVFQSLRLHLSTPETERSQNGALPKGSTFGKVYEGVCFRQNFR